MARQQLEDEELLPIKMEGMLPADKKAATEVTLQATLLVVVDKILNNCWEQTKQYAKSSSPIKT